MKTIHGLTQQQFLELQDRLLRKIELISGENLQAGLYIFRNTKEKGKVVDSLIRIFEKSEKLVAEYKTLNELFENEIGDSENDL